MNQDQPKKRFGIPIVNVGQNFDQKSPLPADVLLSAESDMKRRQAKFEQSKR